MEENILNRVDETNPDFMKTIIIPKNLHYKAMCTTLGGSRIF